MKKVFDGWVTSTVEEFSSDILKIQPLVNAVQKVYPGFYRIENESFRSDTGNDGLLFDYNGLGHASAERLFVLENMQKLGISRTANNQSHYDKGTPSAIDSFLGVRFLISENDLNEEKGYSYLSGGLGLKLFENPYVLPIAILSNEAIMDVSLEEETDVFAIQNRIWKCMTGGKEDVFTEETNLNYVTGNPTDSLDLSRGTVLELLAELDNEDSEEPPEFVKDMFPYIEFSFTAEQNAPVYLYYTYGYIEGFGTRNDLLQYVGTYQRGEAVSSKLYFSDEITKEAFFEIVKNLHVCYANMDTLKEYSSILQGRDATVYKDSDSRLFGNVTAEDGQRLLFTVPYDENWTLWLDGTPLDLEKTMDLFMSVELPAGTHHYELRFWPGGLTLGFYFSGTALSALIAVCVCYSIRKRRNKKQRELLETFSAQQELLAADELAVVEVSVGTDPEK